MFPTKKKDLEEERDAFMYNSVFPTLWLTRESPRKWVRVLGRIGTIPVLPWSVVLTVIYAVLAIIVALGMLAIIVVDKYED